jgi:hypothetical protein
MRNAWIPGLTLLLSAAAAPAANLVAYGPATDSEVTYATDAGHVVTTWDDTEWQAADAGDFAAFDAILVGDGDCGDPEEPSGIWQNSALWGPLVTGEVLMHGHDDHFPSDSANRYDLLTANCADFASSGAGLGLCISIQCTREEDRPEAVEGGGFSGTLTIPGLGDFELDGQSGDDIEIVFPGHPAMAGLTNEDLDCWDSSVHTHMQSFPEAFQVLAADAGGKCAQAREEGGGGPVTGPVIIATLGYTPPLIQEIPTLSPAALAALASLLGVAAFLVLSRRRRA